MKTEPVTRQMRRLLESPGLIASVNVFDPLTARIAQDAGFSSVGLGGFALGARTCVTEPLLTLTETIASAREITRAISIPLEVDCGAGYGDAIHVHRTVREAEAAGIACIYIEDQLYPKRAHYHRGVEKIISVEEMLDKISAALDARQNPDFVIIGRTDAMRTHGPEEAIRRGNIYAEAGCDMILSFPNTVEQARLVPREVDAPCVVVNSPGNRHKRPVYSWSEVEDMGFKMVLDAPGVVLTAAKAVRDMLRRYREEQRPPQDLVEDSEIRGWLETVIGLPDYYAIEERTTER